LHRFPRPPGRFYKPDVEQGGQFGIYVNYEAQATLADALYRLGHLEEAVQEYEECFAYFPPAAPEPLVQRVRERLDFIRRHDGPEREPLRFLAQERYQELLEQFPDSDLVDNALWGQAQQIGNAGNEEEALRLCQRILDEYPDGDVADEVLSAFAEMHSETLHLRDGQLVDGDPDLALQWYRKLVEQFPGSEGAQRAQKRIQEIENLRAEADKWWQRQAPEEAIRASAEGALAGLRSEPAESRQRAAEELGRRRVKEAEAALLPLLQDADAGVREAVAWALGKIGTEQALAPLRALLDDENKGIRTTVQRALLEIKYTGDVVERPYDCPIEWMGKPVISGRHLAMGRNGGPFVYEHQGLHTQGIEWIGKAFPQLRGVPATPGYMLTDRCSARYPAWSPEGTEVVFVATNWATGPQQEENPRQDLWVVPTGGGSERPLTTTGDVVGRPQWWPGQQVLFARQSPERL
jgi:tetratricopeptide (TPR) repeat protein